jgi:hypothetical protein
MADQGYRPLRPRALASPDLIRERVLEAMRADLGIDLRPGDPLWHHADTLGEIAAPLEEQVVEVGDELFEAAGQTIYGVPLLVERAAQGTTTWTLSGVAAGDVIEAGTPLAQGGVVFEVAATVELTPGQTMAAGVPVTATSEGEAGNDITGALELQRTLPFVVSVVLDAPTMLGRDREDRDAYRQRLAGRVAHLGRPTLPADFADRARDHPSAHRVLALDNYVPAGVPNPGDPARTDVERAITLVPVDEAGDGLPQGARDEISAALEAEREPNWIVSVIEPAYTTINVTATVILWDGYEPAEALEQAEQAVAAKLDPATWGTPPNATTPVWDAEPVVRRDEISAVLNSDQVPAVKYVQSVLLNGANADVTLPSPAGLPRPGTMTVTEAP